MARMLRILVAALLASTLMAVVPTEGEATVPGDIGRIAFVSTKDGPSFEIYVREFAGSNPIRITTNTVADVEPCWSPDGTRIAYMSGPDIWVMGPDGSNKTNVTNGVGAYNRVAGWSPDGTRILFVSDRGGNPDLWIVHPDGSDPQQLTNIATIKQTADWSPDGSTIAFEQVINTHADIWLMDADGSNQRQITNVPGNQYDPRWSPDGTRITYTDGDDVWLMNADGSDQTNLTNSTGYSSSEPEWSPDGSRIAFTSSQDGDNDIWMMDPDGTNLAHLTDDPGNEYSVSWESVNRDPIAVGDSADVLRARSVVVEPLVNDTEPDAEALEVSDITRMPTEGSVVINGDGTVTYTHDGRTGSGYPYADSFEYEVQDARLGTARADVTVWVYPSFDDVPESNVFLDDITWLATQGITKGCNPPDNTLFCPSAFVTRGQMAAFLVRALHFTAGAGSDLFVDDDDSVFEVDIDRLGTAGVTKGCNPPVNDRFCPDSLVTRGQMAAFLARAFHLTNLGQFDLFGDDNGSIFELDIDKLGATGVSRGCNPPTNDRFCPNSYVTREQMAAFIHRAVDYVT